MVDKGLGVGEKNLSTGTKIITYLICSKNSCEIYIYM